ncbi:hypothetical protein vseg_000323 [Gypsophila vaccaria]
MLKKSFKPAKCKTALNLTKSRTKLMKNKKDAQMRQIRREVSQLLLNKQDQTARLRVEHVVREEKMLAAYEMIEIYCELIVARLPIIESQKNCPLDLKEAITSLIFAAPRCGDIPELQDIRKHFTAKYGKDFSTAAMELHPACGVSRILVEKLSVKAPDGPEKVKILKGIAEEYNIQWEPNWFEDEDPISSVDVLRIPHMDNSNTTQMKPLNVQRVDSFKEMHSHSTENPEISSQRSANSNTIPQSPTSRSGFSTSENVSEEMLFSPSRTAENPFPVNRQYWNMEFKDATAAAQAAAECAEQASMAARAAAQLSIRDSSHGPGHSSVHGQHEGDRHFANSVSQKKREHETPINRSFNQRTPRMQGHQGYTDQQGDVTKRHDDRRESKEFNESGMQYDIRQHERRESDSATHRVNADHLSNSRESVSTPIGAKDEYDWSNSANIQENEAEPAENPFHGDTVGSLNQPLKFQSQSSGFGDEYSAFSNTKHWSDNIDSDIGFGAFGQGTSEQENWHAKTNLSKFDSNMDESILSDYQERDVYKDFDEKKHGFDSGSSVFVGTTQGPSGYDVDDNVGHTAANAVFDESGSDDDYISPPRHSLIRKDTGLSESFRQSSIYSKLIEPLPLTFDDYDQPSPRSLEEVQTEGSDSEIGGDNYTKHATGSQGTAELFRASSAEKGTAYSVKSVKHMDVNQRTYIGSGDEGKGFESPRSFIIPPGSNGVPEFDHETYSSESSGVSSPSKFSEGGMELNLGSLPGGRRNRPRWRPSDTRGETSGVSSPKFSEAASERFAPNEGNYPPSKLQMSSPQTGTREVSTQSDTVSNYEAVIPPSHSDIEERPYSGSIHENLRERRAKDPTGYFVSDGSSSEEDVPKPVIAKNLPGGGVSRRTKGSARLVSSRPSSNLTTNSVHLSSTSYSTTDSAKLQTQSTSYSSRTIDPSSMDKEATFDVRPGTKVSVKNNSFSPADVEKPGTPTAGISRASVSSEKAPSRENSGKNLSHVHPKLPDFETFAARLQSLRTNRQ